VNKTLQWLMATLWWVCAAGAQAQGMSPDEQKRVFALALGRPCARAHRAVAESKAQDEVAIEALALADLHSQQALTLVGPGGVQRRAHLRDRQAGAVEGHGDPQAHRAWIVAQAHRR
jgi:hypothetical protein